MTDHTTKLLAAASQTAAATSDMIEAARDNDMSQHSNVGSGDTLTILADGTRLLIEAMGEERSEDTNQLHGALMRFLEDRG